MAQAYRKNKHIIAEKKRKQKKLIITWSSAIAAVLVLAFVIGIIVNKANQIPREQYPIVTMNIEGYGKVEIELYPNDAPNTVRNFIALVESKFYDGLLVNRVVENFCVQAGSPDGTLSGGPGYTIKGEFKDNGFKKNTLKHEAGVISMARSTDPDSAGSQFFICTATNSSVAALDDAYAPFGKVISGLDIIKQISEVSHDSSAGSSGGGKPTTNIVITSITVDTKGVEYRKPTVFKQAS